MNILSGILTALNSEVTARLAAASYPALTDGQILFGTAAQYEQSAAPRIIMVPIGTVFSVRSPNSKSATLDTLERRTQHAQRPIATAGEQFEIRCWGAVDNGTPVDDYDMTRALVHCVRASIHHLAPGAYEIDSSGKFTVGSNIVRSGREFVFGLTIFTPVLTSLLPYDRTRQYAPADVAPIITDQLTISTGASEAGCEP